MDETKRERQLRYFLIFIIISLIAFAFFWKFNQAESDREPEQFFLLAAVVKKSVKKDENPSVAVYEYIDGKHILAIYEIQRNNDFFFKTIAAAELKTSPEQLAPASQEKGVWIKVSGEWHYFNELLEEKNRHEKNRGDVNKADFHITKNENETIITINNIDYSLKSHDNVISVYPLSTDENLWLVVTDSDLKILY